MPCLLHAPVSCKCNKFAINSQCVTKRVKEMFCTDTPPPKKGMLMPCSSYTSQNVRQLLPCSWTGKATWRPQEQYTHRCMLYALLHMLYSEIPSADSQDQLKTLLLRIPTMQRLSDHEKRVHTSRLPTQDSSMPEYLHIALRRRRRYEPKLRHLTHHLP